MQAPTARIASRTASGSSWAATTLPTLRQIQSRRRLHQRSELLYDTSKGLQPLFSKEALHLLAVEYQDGLLDRLNKQVKSKLSRRVPLFAKRAHSHWTFPSTDTASENASVAQTVVNTSKDRSQILAFNLASEALNNTYFLSRLASYSLQHAITTTDLISHRPPMLNERTRAQHPI